MILRLKAYFIVTCFMIVPWLHAQNNFFVDFGIGASSFTGYALLANLSFEHKKQVFSARGTFSQEFYNSGWCAICVDGDDRFSEAALLYGRSLRVKHWFFVLFQRVLYTLNMES